MYKVYLKSVILILLFLILQGESLWDPAFTGYTNSQSTVKEGDVLLVTIDLSESISLDSVKKDSKNVTFEFSGGEFGNLISFLPKIKTGSDNSIKGEENYSIQSQLAVQVISITSGGIVYVEGNKSITLDGKKESVTLSGYLD